MLQSFDNIIKGCSKRNRKCQQQLYQLYYGYGMSICIRYASDEEDAIKILNNSFMKLFSKISKCETEAEFKVRLQRTIKQTAVNGSNKGKMFSIRFPFNLFKRAIY